MLNVKTDDTSMANTDQGSVTAVETAAPTSHDLWKTWRENLLLFCITGVYVELCLHLCVFGSMDRYAGYPVLFGLLGGRTLHAGSLKPAKGSATDHRDFPDRGAGASG